MTYNVLSVTLSLYTTITRLRLLHKAIRVVVTYRVGGVDHYGHQL